MATHTIISLFSGAGMLDAAIRVALPDARTVCFVEREAPAAAILAARMRDGALHEAPIWSDIPAFDGKPWRGKVAGIVGGFPCQDLSVAGARAGLEGEKSGLWWHYARIIEEVEPQWVFIENVPGILSADGRRYPCLCGWPNRWRGVLRGEESLQALLQHRAGDRHEHEGNPDTQSNARDIRWLSEHISECNGEMVGGSDMEFERLRATVSAEAMAPVSEAKGNASGHNYLAAGGGCAGTEGSQWPAGLDTGEDEPISGVGDKNDRTESQRAGSFNGELCPVCGQQIDETGGQSIRGAMGDVLWSIAALGFDAEWSTLRASDVGASHRRDRAFILAYRQTAGRRASRSDEAQERSAGTFNAYGEQLAHATQRVLGELQEPSGRGGLADWVDAAVGYAELSGRPQPINAGVTADAAEVGAGLDHRPERAGGMVDNPAGPRCERRQPGEGGPIRDEARRGEPCGRCDALEDTGCPERRPDDEREGCGCERCDGQGEAAGRAGESGDVSDVANAERTRRETETDARISGEASEPPPNRPTGGDSLPLFPPGPGSSAAWQRILAERPDLAPAVESGLRGLADVSASRVDRLRAGGNGVVVLQAAFAFTVLTRRAGLNL